MDGVSLDVQVLPSDTCQSRSISAALQSPIGVVARVPSAETAQRRGTAPATMETRVLLPLPVTRQETLQADHPVHGAPCPCAHACSLDRPQPWVPTEGSWGAVPPAPGRGAAAMARVASQQSSGVDS